AAMITSSWPAKCSSSCSLSASLDSLARWATSSLVIDMQASLATAQRRSELINRLHHPPSACPFPFHLPLHEGRPAGGPVRRRLGRRGGRWPDGSGVGRAPAPP